MKTGSWKTYQGAGRIGISAGSPRGAPAGYKLFKTLAPDKAWMHNSKAIYLPKYEAILAALDPVKVWDDIHTLANGAEPVIMCFEVPPFTESNFCHRRIVAEWFERELGHIVPEVGFENAPRKLI